MLHLYFTKDIYIQSYIFILYPLNVGAGKIKGGEYRKCECDMKKTLLGVFICMMLVGTVLPITGFVIAGDEKDPEIVDGLDEPAVVSYLDIISAWFYETEDMPDYLFVGLKLKEINTIPPQQHMSIIWEYNGTECTATIWSLGSEPWFSFAAGYGNGFWFQRHFHVIKGEYDKDTGIITMEIPKDVIKSPKKGDVLTHTFALSFERFGYLGSLGFDRQIFVKLLSMLIQKSLRDLAPNTGYGRDYIIQYGA